MTATHIHLLLNHFPIIGTLLGIAVMIHGFVISSNEVKRVALWCWVVMAAVAIPVFLTGEPAEEAVEGLAGVSENLIHEHEESAELSFWLMEALGLFSILSLFIAKLKPAFGKSILLLTSFLALAVFGFMVRTGYLGGQIRHTEIGQSQNFDTEGVESHDGEGQDD